ncbi:MAG: M48 family metalloprotease [Alphaproteobacteria bacterium]|nr:M48 family metalloprotease [Alphaproteobacteria bacterium]
MTLTKELQAVWLAIVAVAVVAIAGVPLVGRSQNVSLIRDLELENAVRVYLYALRFQEHLPDSNPRVLIVNSAAANAFTDGGDDIFFTVGFWLRATNVSSALAVTAHEMGHVEGGHVASTRIELSRGAIASGLSLAVALPLAIATGIPQILLGEVLILSTATSANLANRRERESIADEFATKAMINAGYDPIGLADFLLAVDPTVHTARDDWYTTHPLTESRVSHVRSLQARQSPPSPPPAAAPPAEGETPATSKQAQSDQHHRIDVTRRLLRDEDLDRIHHRAVARATALLHPKQIKEHYPDHADPIHQYGYVVAAAFDRQLDTDYAADLATSLRKQWGDDAFLYGLSGHLALANGDFPAAQRFYAAGLALFPSASYWRIGYAAAVLRGIEEGGRNATTEPAATEHRDVLEVTDVAEGTATGTSEARLREALRVLAPAHIDAPVLIELYRHEARIYALLEDDGRENLALARLFRSRRQLQRARTYYTESLALIPQGETDRTKAEDELILLEFALAKQK